MATGDDLQDWRAWLPEAFALVTEWDEASPGRRLTVAEARDLAERIARALQAAVRRGSPQPGPYW